MLQALASDGAKPSLFAPHRCPNNSAWSVIVLERLPEALCVLENPSKNASVWDHGNAEMQWNATAAASNAIATATALSVGFSLNLA